MKNIFFRLTLLFVGVVSAQEEFNTEEVITVEAIQKTLDSINNSFNYEKGTVTLNDEVAVITIPSGYKFLNAEQSKTVLTDYWGNPPSETLGMLFPEEANPIGDTFTYAVEITYSEDGYIDDEDAKDIDYDDLLQEMKEDAKSSNEERAKQGYDTMEFVGWASAPFYDEINKKLHWAQEIKFGEAEMNTLNYNIRVLGRKGYLNLNVIGDMSVLPQVKNDVNDILASVSFNEGHRYVDFNPDFDEVAAYGIGGLIAGKVLAKAGFFVLILKFWKFIAIGVIGLFSAFKSKIFGSK